MSREAQLIGIVRADPDLMRVLTRVRELNLPDWRVFSGAVYQSVWNALTGRAPGYGVRDYDVGYFDTDTSWDAEDEIIKRVAAAFEEPLRSKVEVRNQARVPLWFPAHFGEPYDPISGVDEALERFVAPAFAVGVRLEADDSISVAAPLGLEDVFALTLRPNPNRGLAKDWSRVVERAKARWPELVVVEPGETAWRQWTVDAFASAPFRGNPACVVEPLTVWPSDGWMQALARENNQAETAFLRRTDDPACFHLRWFTPGREVDLCGHATLASAHVLIAELGCGAERLRFETRSGPLFVERSDDGYAMDFPADPPRRTGMVAGLAEALGVEPVEVWAARYLVAVLADAAAVRALEPDIRALARLQGEAGEPGEVIVCAAADGGDDVDVVDRFFAPGCGIDEDPATGSAHCILGPLYADKLRRRAVRFRQVFPGRGGEIETDLRGDRVVLRGRAATTVESVLRV